ncbi:hypothetical protein SERLA73DRAFT_166789 [Serpula lacrymans var. lacrymans S7.3]|uniref:Uncharacterized protein n=2 Tax=Serpula lacrymans var. lacrymans TaxID=341189 RepID=F8PR50_SERL3|nr:uncharacterized protein SERLADRAFT_462542 [Serpula lacrymans var. lacrymans S7.9]EGO02341.1 hypothetical protein SERLA73DRAFT_166789 [Serpula lacrymans var. lacrymans S7.3]EGO28076.1 hypothetical protein SERLADRAFT_462542 [Serpula lacrymans var. lacrymans S7.9]
MSSTSSSSTSILRGGALLRTLRRISDGKIISGPSLLVDEILRLSNAASIQELVTQKWNGDIRGFPPPGSPADSCHTSLYLQTKDKGVSSSTKPHIYRSPRIGLDLSNPETTDSRSPLHPRVMFLAKPYRYFTNPHLLTANGRGQTYVGVYRECLQSRSLTDDDEDMLTKELCRILGIKEQVVKRYLTDYKLGYDKGSLRSFIGPAGKGASASLSTYLKMMGTLQRVYDEAMLPQFTTTKGEEEGRR